MAFTATRWNALFRDTGVMADSLPSPGGPLNYNTLLPMKHYDNFTSMILDLQIILL
jgi:hypothetical protein